MAIAIFSATERVFRRYGSASKLLSARSLIRPLYRLLRDAVYEVSDYLVRAACVQGALGTAAPQPSSPVLMKVIE